MKPCRAGIAGITMVLGLVAGCGDQEPEPSPTSTTTPSTPATPSATSPAPTSSGPAPGRMLPAGYLPLWPFSDLEETRAWQRSFQAGGHAPWHLDAGETALAFTRGHLGFTGVDRVTSRSVNGREARIGVGYRAEGTEAATAAVIHLFRAGDGEDAPWEVVGTDDTTLTLTTPAYGARASSPATVAGRITGVDENLQAKILRPDAEAPLGTYCCLPAGGQDTPWRLTLSYEGEPEEVSTIVVWTGGHVAEVERFAVTGIRP